MTRNALYCFYLKSISNIFKLGLDIGIGCSSDQHNDNIVLLSTSGHGGMYSLITKNACRSPQLCVGI